MKLSKLHKVCIAVLALLLVGLVVDRVFFRSGGVGPQVSAAAAGGVSNEAPPENPLSSPTGPGIRTRQTLAERLDGFSRTRSLELAAAQDAFTLPRAWAAKCRSEGPSGPRPTPAQVFACDHQLKAVAISGCARSAVLDDCCLVVGQKLDGFRLVSICEHSVTFESDGDRVVLKLKDDN